LQTYIHSSSIKTVAFKEGKQFPEFFVTINNSIESGSSF